MRYLGRKSELTTALRSIGELPPEERGKVGQAANAVRQALEELIGRRIRQLEDAELDARLSEDRIDVTLPGDPPRPRRPAAPDHRDPARDRGHLHRARLLRRRGPRGRVRLLQLHVAEPAAGHPARMLQDTFYFSDEVLLRTHTSPMQTRAMEAQEPPIYIVIPGKTYRRDSDATHTPMFHQVEGLAVDENITLADLQGVLLEFARAMFGPEREIRLRPNYFPFTEPSVEVDVSCFACGGTRRAAGRLARQPLQGLGLDRDPRLGDGRPERASASCDLRPRALPGLRVRDGHRADRDAASTACPTCACSSRTTCRSWSSSDEGARLMAARVLLARSARPPRSPSGSTSPAPSSRGSSASAWGTPTGSWSGACSRPSRTPTPTA